MNCKEIGSCEAVLAGISTKIDGSVKITLEVNPNDQELIGRLINCYLENRKLLTVAFVEVEHD